jgi:hypothetical protein
MTTPAGAATTLVCIILWFGVFLLIDGEADRAVCQNLPEKMAQVMTDTDEAEFLELEAYCKEKDYGQEP